MFNNRLARLIVLVTLAFGAAGAGTASIQESIQEALVQRHPVDTPEWWRGLGPETPGVAIQMFQASTNELHRIHLLQGLSAFPDSAEAVAFLKEQTGSDASVIRNAAIGSLGASQGEKALGDLEGFLKHEDPQTRFAAARAIRRIPGERAQGALDDYLKGEKLSWIADRVKSEAPPAGGFRPIPASQVPVAQDLEGEWKGFWIEFAKGSDSTLVSLPSVARVSVPASGAIRGEIQIGGKGKRLLLDKGNFQSGQLRGTLSDPKRPGNPVPVQAELVQQGTRRILLWHVPSWGSNSVMTRSVTIPKSQ
jgi:hypothetical protein